MRKNITLLTEEEVNHIAKRLAKRIEPKKNLHDEIFDYLKEYIDKGCVKFKLSDRYITVDVGAPLDFLDAGFEREDANRVKGKLRSKGFTSLGVGLCIKEK